MERDGQHSVVYLFVPLVLRSVCTALRLGTRAAVLGVGKLLAQDKVVPQTGHSTHGSEGRKRVQRLTVRRAGDGACAGAGGA